MFTHLDQCTCLVLNHPEEQGLRKRGLELNGFCRNSGEGKLLRFLVPQILGTIRSIFVGRYITQKKKDFRANFLSADVHKPTHSGSGAIGRWTSGTARIPKSQRQMVCRPEPHQASLLNQRVQDTEGLGSKRGLRVGF